MNNLIINKKIIYAVSAILLVVSVLAFVLWWQIRTPLNSAADDFAVFEVAKGDSAKTIAENLEKAGLIKSPFLFRLYVYLSLGQYDLKPGEYELSPKMSVRDIGDIMVLGGTNEVLITIPEGFSLKQIENRLIEAGLANSGELADFRFAQNEPPILTDKPISASLEGYLFPDTYRFFKDANLSDIVGKIINNLDGKLTSDLREAVESSSYNVHQILIMASLIEKEVPKDADRPIVAGILWKRLEANMPLQVDATLVYITGNGEIKESDKKINSPYNTYLYRGLPKGPISNPGLSAIKSAISPKASPYWYYLSTKDGTTIYSKTLDEHNRNRAIYLK